MWAGTPTQWAFAVVFAATVAMIVVWLAYCVRSQRLERQLLRAVMAMARVPDELGGAGRRRTGGSPMVEVAMVSSPVAPGGKRGSGRAGPGDPSRCVLR